MKKKQQKIESDYEDAMKGTSAEDAIPYDMGANLGFKDVVDHKIFGLGVVGDVITPNKVEIQFQEGKKILVCVLKTDEPGS